MTETDLSKDQRDMARVILAEKISQQQLLKPRDESFIQQLEETKICVTNFYMYWIRIFGDNYSKLSELEKNEAYRFFNTVIKK